ncbi:MAG: hypothetical protein D6806_04075 [Deltaproteobacteria bacterium]|nr:MAG: hypothetical protein D6806_04075 [Deltaproteobacteria bacterium]
MKILLEKMLKTCPLFDRTGLSTKYEQIFNRAFDMAGFSLALLPRAVAVQTNSNNGPTVSAGFANVLIYSIRIAGR